MTKPIPILCIECQSKPAVVFLSQIVDGELVQRNLCTKCATPYFDNPPEAPPFTFMSPPSVNPDFLARPHHCPSKLALPEKMTLEELSQKLHAKPFQILAVLVTHNVFITGKEPLDYETAAVVCRQYGVRLVREGDGETREADERV